MLLRARGLQAIRLEDCRYLFKCGIREIVVSGADVDTIVEPLVTLLDEPRPLDDILARFPAPQRADVKSLIDGLVQRGLVSGNEDTTALDPRHPRALQESFYRSFGAVGQRAPQALAQADIVVVGVNSISKTLIERLIECGVERILWSDDAVLNNHLEDFGTAPTAVCTDSGAAGKVRHVANLPDLSAQTPPALICATSDLGFRETLLEVNRLALSLKCPFLPVWLDEFKGFVGPLNYPYESSCLRCFQIRWDSNDPQSAITRAKRRFHLENPERMWTAGFLRPMAGVLGEIASMEIVKALGGFVPSNVIGRIIQTNLVDHSSLSRRVLKVPRCPDCSDQTRTASATIFRGPQIPVPEDR